MARGGEKARKSTGMGPSVPTPFSERFYAAWKDSGRTLDSLARATGLPVATVSAYINGTRGSGGQRRSVEIVTALAAALDVPVDEALELSGMSSQDGVLAMIDRDPDLTRGQKAALRLQVLEYRKMGGPK